MTTPTPYPWMEDSQYVTTPVVTGYLAVTSPNGLYLSNGISTTTITPNDVSSTIFNGDLDGNAGTATTATNAINVEITNDSTSSTALFPVFVSSNTNYQALKVDSTQTPLSYVPFTSTLTASTFVGALSGNATTATTATNIAGGLGGQIHYQSAVNTTALLANGTAGQYLKSNGTTLAPSWVNQNLAATASGLPTTVSATSANRTLTVNFNSSFSSVTNYTVNFTGSATTTQTINAYTLSGGVAGGQYNVVIQLTCSGGGTTTWTFNGTGLATTQKTNFVTITTTAMTTGNTRYVVLTFAYDGTNYFMSGSNFT
jgi:hypothetical protein